ncbi:hypothetical protein BJ508DRAFT_340769 [Ascobolus immersus RN42]|uniref:Uncharacterized protein n=1 Tax=Ascobolus immersus RN42 TaxID=1160509 RepID=A0A3N4HWA0_ASCIM|nr:hypothetical protein BJ508DRAFT_340769 [Ascobolus immersus RN42]
MSRRNAGRGKLRRGPPSILACGSARMPSQVPAWTFPSTTSPANNDKHFFFSQVRSPLFMNLHPSGVGKKKLQQICGGDGHDDRTTGQPKQQTSNPDQPDFGFLSEQEQTPTLPPITVSNSDWNRPMFRHFSDPRSRLLGPSKAPKTKETTPNFTVEGVDLEQTLLQFGSQFSLTVNPP